MRINQHLKYNLLLVGSLFVLNNYAQNLNLTNGMDLYEIEEAMNRYPPKFENGCQRLLIMESLDKIMNFSVRDNSRDEEKLKKIVSFYRNQVDKGLETLEQTQVKEGVHIFKFYSSSLILKSRDGTIAIDFCQGPVGNDYKLESYSNEGEPESSDYFKTDFFMTQQQRDRLAKQVDVYLITHPHQDHTDYSLAKRMSEMGKPIVGPEQLRYKWEDLSENITVPGYFKRQKIGPCDILSQSGYQYKKAIKLENGELWGVPDRYFSHDVESIRYLIKMGGITFLHSAETQTEAYAWLEMAKNIDWNVEVLISAGMWQGEKSVMKFLENNRIKYFSLPVHEFEITHGKGGQRSASRMEGENKKKFDDELLMPLLWGEDYLLTEQMLKINAQK